MKLDNPLTWKSFDGNDTLLAGVTVTFTILTGGGTLSATTGTTDANGQAESTLTLGSEPGTNTVETRVENIDETVTFNAEATLPPPTPTALSIVSGENQEGLTGEPLADPFGVTSPRSIRRPSARGYCNLYPPHRRWRVECRDHDDRRKWSSEKRPSPSVTNPVNIPLRLVSRGSSKP